MTPSTTPSVPTGVKVPIDPHRAQRTWLLEAHHKDVSVRLLDGKSLVGELVEFDQFSLIVWPEDAASPSLVYKHGVAVVSLVDREAS